MGIYRGEVIAIMGTLGDIVVNTRRIIELLEEEDGEEEEEEGLDS